VPTLTENSPREFEWLLACREHLCRAVILGLLLTIPACGGPSEREYKNRRELEALLTALSLRNRKELEKDARRIDDRHASGELSDNFHEDLQEIIAKARAGDWGQAEKTAYEFRERYPFFK
jgi:hypothetical protein